MNPTAFDTLARAFTTAGSRRRLLARLVAALPAVGVLAAREDGPAASAAKRNRQQRNNPNNNNPNNNPNNNKNRNKGKGQDPVCTVGQICGQPSTCPTDCFCVQSVEGPNFCIQFTADNCLTRCTSSAECAGGFCATAQCCSSGGQGQDGFTACIPAASLCAT
jgi:hypothetical protein